MQAAAEMAGVSPGSLYQYFPNKDALVAEIIERESAREMASYLEAFCAIPGEADIFVVLDSLVRAVLAYQRARADLMHHALAAVPHLGRFPALSSRAQQVMDFLRRQLEARASAFPDVDPALAAHVLANSIHSLTHDGVIARPEGLDDETLAREISILVRGYLMGHGVSVRRP